MNREKDRKGNKNWTVAEPQQRPASGGTQPAVWASCQEKHISVQSSKKNLTYGICLNLHIFLKAVCFGQMRVRLSFSSSDNPDGFVVTQRMNTWKHIWPLLKHSGWPMMLWDCFSSKCLGLLVRKRGFIKALRHRGTLNQNLVDSNR